MGIVVSRALVHSKIDGDLRRSCSYGKEDEVSPRNSARSSAGSYVVTCSCLRLLHGDSLHTSRREIIGLESRL